MALLMIGKGVGSPPGVASLNPELEGAAQIMLETGIQFDVVDENSDLARYAAAFIPDGVSLSAIWQKKLEHYLAQGGKLVVSGTGALDPLDAKFQLKEIPVSYQGLVPTRPSYLRPDAFMLGESELAADYDYVFYDQAHLVTPVEGSQCYGEIKQAMFNRTWEHFTSHQHAPVGASLNSPIAVCKDNVLYLAAPLFGGYRTWDYWAYRVMAVNLLRKFLPPALILLDAPGWVEVTLHTQPKDINHSERRIVHLVAYHPRRSWQSIPHVDQSWSTGGLSIRVRSNGNHPQRVYLAPGEQELPFIVTDGYIHIQLPPIGAHAVIVLEG
jgi:hypothetical protein